MKKIIISIIAIVIIWAILMSTDYYLIKTNEKPIFSVEIAAYKEFIAKSENLESVEKNLRISSFLAMKDSTKIPNKNDIRYMHIGEEREYQNRTKPLPTVNQIIKK